MGRLIDADVLREEVYSWGMNDYEPSDFTDAIDDAPTVEAIPKAEIKKFLEEGTKDVVNNVLAIVREDYIHKSDYEARLKADLKAILVELQLEIEEMVNPFSTRISGCSQDGWKHGVKNCDFVIQEKINALKENKDGNDKEG